MADALSFINVPEHSSTIQPSDEHQEEICNKNVDFALSDRESSLVLEFNAPSTKETDKDDAVSMISLRDCSPAIEFGEESEKGSNHGNILDKASYWNGFYGVLLLVTCIAFTSIVTLIPRQNSILYPEYWYQAVVLYQASLFRVTALIMFQLFLFTEAKILLSMNTILKVHGGVVLAFVVAYCGGYVTWTIYLGNHHPLPFIGFCVFIPNWTEFCFARFLFPTESRTRRPLKKQLKFWILHRLWYEISLNFVQMSILTALPTIIPSQHQWTLAIVIPAVRNTNSWVTSKIVENTPGIATEALDFYANSQVMYVFTNFIAARLDSLDNFTVYSLFCIEIAIHVHACYKIIQLNTKVEQERVSGDNENKPMAEDKKRRVRDLVMSEFIEAFVPIAFGLCFATAYYGPNAELFVGVKSDYFGKKPLADIGEFYILLSQMFAFDVLAMVISAASLNYFCNINLYQEFCNMMKKYWLFFLIIVPGTAGQFGTRDVNFAADFSMNFIWTTDEG